MEAHLDSRRYRELRARLKELQCAAIPDMQAIDAVIEQLAAEQLQLKSRDGQHGNNPQPSSGRR